MEWDDSGSKGRDGQKNKIRKANKKRKKSKNFHQFAPKISYHSNILLAIYEKKVRLTMPTHLSENLVKIGQVHFEIICLQGPVKKVTLSHLIAFWHGRLSKSFMSHSTK